MFWSWGKREHSEETHARPAAARNQNMDSFAVRRQWCRHWATVRRGVIKKPPVSHTVAGQHVHSSFVAYCSLNQCCFQCIMCFNLVENSTKNVLLCARSKLVKHYRTALGFFFFKNGVGNGLEDFEVFSVDEKKNIEQNQPHPLSTLYQRSWRSNTYLNHFWLSRTPAIAKFSAAKAPTEERQRRVSPLLLRSLQRVCRVSLLPWPVSYNACFTANNWAGNHWIMILSWWH